MKPALHHGLRACLVTLLASPALAQTTWNVPGDFATIQSAVGAAQPGDTVLVGPGNWPVTHIEFFKEITLKSAAGPHLTVLDGQFLDLIVHVTNGVDSTARIEGFTFWRGQSWGGGAMRLDGDAAPTVVDCIFRSNRGLNGSSGSTGSTGSNSSTIGAQGGTGGTGGSGGDGVPGGAVWIDAGSPRFVNCSFYDNRGGNGGSGGQGGQGGKGGPWGVFSEPGQGGTGGIGGIGGSGGRGGALAVVSGSPHLIGCFFNANRAGNGGAGGSGGSGGPGGNGVFEDGPTGSAGSPRSGTSGAWGGALATLEPGGAFAVRNCVFLENDAGFGGFGPGSASDGSTGQAAAIVVTFGSSLALENSILRANSGTSTDVRWLSGSAPLVSHTVTDFPPYAGAANFEADPLLVAGDESWHIPRLAPGSPCIDAADGAALEASVATDAYGVPRRLDDPLTVDGPNAGSPALDVGAAEFTPPAHLEVLDCAFNPAGSLVHLSGAATPGDVLAFELDNPVATQGLSLVFGVIGLGAFASEANPCGLPIPGFGMSGAGALGGLAADPNASLPLQFVGLWNGTSTVPWNVGLPNIPSIHGIELTLQAVFVEVAAGAVPLGLTTAVRTVIGA